MVGSGRGLGPGKGCMCFSILFTQRKYPSFCVVHSDEVQFPNFSHCVVKAGPGPKLLCFPRGSANYCVGTFSDMLSSLH